MNNSVTAELSFLNPVYAAGPVQQVDLRTQAKGPTVNQVKAVEVVDASKGQDLGLETSGFTLLRRPSLVADFYDCAEVMRTYYAECRATAQELTGAHTTFTFDHIIREPGLQITGGGTDGGQHTSDVQAGGGYINSVHMDYTDNTTWNRYLAIHGERLPAGPSRSVVLNFWRPLSESADQHPLAVCDARTLQAEDLQEVVIYGYGSETYSWHDIGIETFSVSASDRQRWYYYPGMTPQDVLVLKSFDADGVIGRACPHASFAHAAANGEPRRSIELRVLCFC